MAKSPAENKMLISRGFLSSWCMIGFPVFDVLLKKVILTFLFETSITLPSFHDTFSLL